MPRRPIASIVYAAAVRVRVRVGVSVRVSVRVSAYYLHAPSPHSVDSIRRSVVPQQGDSGVNEDENEDLEGRGVAPDNLLDERALG